MLTHLWETVSLFYLGSVSLLEKTTTLRLEPTNLSKMRFWRTSSWVSNLRAMAFPAFPSLEKTWFPWGCFPRASHNFAQAGKKALPVERPKRHHEHLFFHQFGWPDSCWYWPRSFLYFSKGQRILFSLQQASPILQGSCNVGTPFKSLAVSLCLMPYFFPWPWFSIRESFSTPLLKKRLALSQVGKGVKSTNDDSRAQNDWDNSNQLSGDSLCSPWGFLVVPTTTTRFFLSIRDDD